MHNKNSECFGCVIYERNFNKCFMRKNNNEKQCPCRTCIIKVTCNINCDEFEKVANSIKIYPKKPKFK